MFIQIQIHRISGLMHQQLVSFLASIDPQHLNGLHILTQTYLNKYIQPLTQTRALQIHHNICLNHKTKLKKNWKFQQVCLMAYILDKISIKFKTNIYQVGQQIWEKLASYLPSRTPFSCKCKFLSFCPIRVVDVPWTYSEDQILRELIKEHGFDWKQISELLHLKSQNKIYRTSKQCKQHYGCFLKPDLKKGYWSQQEDYLLICSFLKYGKKWSKISKQISGRNENAIKNRFYLLFQSNSRHKKAYNSEIMRNVRRKKERIQNSLKVKEEESVELEEKGKEKEDNLQMVKVEAELENWDQNVYRHDLEQYFSF